MANVALMAVTLLLFRDNFLISWKLMKTRLKTRTFLHVASPVLNTNWSLMGTVRNLLFVIMMVQVKLYVVVCFSSHSGWLLSELASIPKLSLILSYVFYLFIIPTYLSIYYLIICSISLHLTLILFIIGGWSLHWARLISGT